MKAHFRRYGTSDTLDGKGHVHAHNTGADEAEGRSIGKHRDLGPQVGVTRGQEDASSEEDLGSGTSRTTMFRKPSF